MVRKDSVRLRLEGREQGISYTEFSYMLLQSWDFLQLYDRYGCRLQLGGSDQWGNITEGVDLIRRLREVQAFGLTSPLVTKADGTKFGKTEAGAVWLDPRRTSPYQFFQYWIRTSDAEVGGLLRRLTFRDRATIEALDEATVQHPERREAQRVLARELTTMVHGDVEASRAERAAEVLFTEAVATLDQETLASVLADAPSSTIGPDELDGPMLLSDALVRTGLASSKSDARRQLQGGGVYVNNRRQSDDRPIGREDADRPVHNSAPGQDPAARAARAGLTAATPRKPSLAGVAASGSDRGCGNLGRDYRQPPGGGKGTGRLPRRGRRGPFRGSHLLRAAHSPRPAGVASKLGVGQWGR